MPLNQLRLPRLEVALAAGLTAVLDQASKVSAQAFLQPHPPRPLISGLLYLTYTQNTGAAFGLLREYGFLLSALSLLFLLAVILFTATTPLTSRGMRLALGAGIGGAVSNLLDRFTKGYVVDFIDFRVWPVFNLADIAIVLGLGLVCLRLLLRRPMPVSPVGSGPAQELSDTVVEGERNASCCLRRGGDPLGSPPLCGGRLRGAANLTPSPPPPPDRQATLGGRGLPSSDEGEGERTDNNAP